MSIDNQSPSNDLVEFVQFAVKHLGSGGPQLTPEELVQQWRAKAEYWETVQDIRDGFAEFASGGGKSPSEVLRDLRQSLGISP
jgi:hypothetical protein